jgi:hypothetical protein
LSALERYVAISAVRADALTKQQLLEEWLEEVQQTGDALQKVWFVDLVGGFDAYTWLFDELFRQHVPKLAKGLSEEQLEKERRKHIYSFIPKQRESCWETKKKGNLGVFLRWLLRLTEHHDDAIAQQAWIEARKAVVYSCQHLRSTKELYEGGELEE